MKARPLVELLKELQKFGESEQVKGKIISGLCLLVMFMRNRDIINFDEEKILKDFIENYRPIEGSKFYRASQKDSPYYWKVGSWKPRNMWLKDNIKRYNSQQKNT